MRSPAQKAVAARLSKIKQQLSKDKLYKDEDEDEPVINPPKPAINESNIIPSTGSTIASRTRRHTKNA